MPTLILNDVHLGAQRVAGTTPNTQVMIRDYVRNQLELTLEQYLDVDVAIPGDLFDGFYVDVDEWLKDYMIFKQWLSRTKRKLILGAGNHDKGKRSDRLSSFGLLCALLKEDYPDQVIVVDEVLTSIGNIHIIPHCMNQDLFDVELEKALELEPGFLLLHANVDNGFAEDSDHSLNVSAAQLVKLAKKHHVLFAHEHQGRTVNYTGAKYPVTVLGNQWPTSVSDCLSHGEAQKDGKKYAHIITDEGTLEKVVTWSTASEYGYTTVDWTDLESAHLDGYKFVRVTGEASAELAADVISTISRFRTKSDIWVITNAVKIGGVAGVDDLTEVSFEQITAFDVLGALMELMTPEEQVVIKELLND